MRSSPFVRCSPLVAPSHRHRPRTPASPRPASYRTAPTSLSSGLSPLKSPHVLVASLTCGTSRAGRGSDEWMDALDHKRRVGKRQGDKQGTKEQKERELQQGQNCQGSVERGGQSRRGSNSKNPLTARQTPRASTPSCRAPSARRACAAAPAPARTSRPGWPLPRPRTA